MTESKTNPGTLAVSGEPEISVVLPCLNEADTLATCLRKIRQVFEQGSIRGEIVVADNGSTDGSVGIAEELGARVVHVKEKGYGNALMGGISQAQGRYVLMGDADDSYDFLEIPKFLEKIREGYDLVQGCRLPRGGGSILAGAMPWSHRWIGNPLFSYFCRSWFGAPIHDVYCGMRAFTREFYGRIDSQCVGMEFATEMIIKASLYAFKVAEVPITLHCDGRVSHPPHLKTVRDGWRTLRFFLMYSPRWLFLVPGMCLVGLGAIGYALGLPGVRIGPAVLDVHTLLYSTVAIVCGYQSVLFALMSKTYAMSVGLMPRKESLMRFFKYFYLERGLLAGGLSLLMGLLLMAHAVGQWSKNGFGPLDYAQSLRWAIPGSLLTLLGFQTVVFSFFVSILGLKRK